MSLLFRTVTKQGCATRMLVDNFRTRSADRPQPVGMFIPQRSSQEYVLAWWVLILNESIPKALIMQRNRFPGHWSIVIKEQQGTNLCILYLKMTEESTKQSTQIHKRINPFYASIFTTFSWPWPWPWPCTVSKKKRRYIYCYSFTIYQFCSHQSQQVSQREGYIS